MLHEGRNDNSRPTLLLCGLHTWTDSHGSDLFNFSEKRLKLFVKLERYCFLDNSSRLLQVNQNNEE